jgi:hypothetical protein
MYMAPELLSLPDGTYCVDAALDVWAFGVVIFIVLFCEPPWKVASIHLDKRYKRHVKHVIGEGVVDELWTVLAEPFRESLLSMLDVRAHQFNLFVFVLPFVALFLPLRTFSLSVLHAAEFHCCPFSPHLLLRPIHGYCMALMIQQRTTMSDSAPTHARTHAQAHTRTHTHTHTPGHTHTHTHLVTHTHTHTHTALAISLVAHESCRWQRDARHRHVSQNSCTTRGLRKTLRDHPRNQTFLVQTGARVCLNELQEEDEMPFCFVSSEGLLIRSLPSSLDIASAAHAEFALDSTRKSFGSNSKDVFVVKSRTE